MYRKKCLFVFMLSFVWMSPLFSSWSEERNRRDRNETMVSLAVIGITAIGIGAMIARDRGITISSISHKVVQTGKNIIAHKAVRFGAAAGVVGTLVWGVYTYRLLNKMLAEKSLKIFTLQNDLKSVKQQLSQTEESRNAADRHISGFCEQRDQARNEVANLKTQLLVTHGQIKALNEKILQLQCLVVSAPASSEEPVEEVSKSEEPFNVDSSSLNDQQRAVRDWQKIQEARVQDSFAKLKKIYTIISAVYEKIDGNVSRLADAVLTREVPLTEENYTTMYRYLNTINQWIDTHKNVTIQVVNQREERRSREIAAGSAQALGNWWR